MIRIICPSCGSKLNAKERLIGQTRACPRCGQPILITAPESAEPASKGSDQANLPESVAAMPSLPVDEPDPAQFGLLGSKKALPSQHVLKKLDRHNRYWVCDHSHIVAAWAADGKGWMLKTTSGMISAMRNREKVPNQGNFVLVELKIAPAEEGMKLTGITTYQLPNRWALPAIIEGDDQICKKVTGYGTLTKPQKCVIRLAIREQFMHEIWEGATKVLEYLNNADFHTHSVMEDSEYTSPPGTNKDESTVQKKIPLPAEQSGSDYKMSSTPPGEGEN
jgi:hypothetical protein